MENPFNSQQLPDPWERIPNRLDDDFRGTWEAKIGPITLKLKSDDGIDERSWTANFSYGVSISLEKSGNLHAAVPDAREALRTALMGAIQKLDDLARRMERPDDEFDALRWLQAHGGKLRQVRLQGEAWVWQAVAEPKSGTKIAALGHTQAEAASKLFDKWEKSSHSHPK